VSGGFNWARFFQDQGKSLAQLEQLRAEVKGLQAKLDSVAKSQAETHTLVAAARGAWRAIAIATAIIGALATLAARWWVALHTGG
jgi:hypothetical protein